MLSRVALTLVCGLALASPSLADGTSPLFAQTASGSNPSARAPLGNGICTPFFVNPGDSEPEFSPDGTKVAFTRRLPTGPSVMVWNRKTRVLRRIAEGQEPSWSPDCESLVFSRTIDVPDSGVGTCLPTQDDLFVVRLHGNVAPTAITNTIDVSEGSPSWSPGRRITYAFGGGIALVSPDGSQRRVIVSAAGAGSVYFASPSWSLSRKKLVYAAGWDLFVFTYDGQKPHQLTHGVQERSYMQPAWSANGRLIAFTQVEGFAYSVQLMRNNGSSAHPITDGLEPSWSPDGRSILIVEERITKDSSGAGFTNDCLYLHRVDRQGTPSQAGKLLLPQDKQPAGC
jgi:Tol biopolymer transport system component